MFSSRADDVIRFPVHTFSSGATNSLRGASFLSGLKDAIVIDIGGTSSDVGVLRKGFPKEASTRVKVFFIFNLFYCDFPGMKFHLIRNHTQFVS